MGGKLRPKTFCGPFSIYTQKEVRKEKGYEGAEQKILKTKKENKCFCTEFTQS
jgi:hypothetical protein